MAQRLHIDLETCSEADLKKTGAWVYAQHASTFVSCMGYAFDNDPPEIWTPGKNIVPYEVVEHVRDGGEVHAWNAAFEFVIWNEAFFRRSVNLPKLQLEQLHCSMIAAAYWGLPMSLEMAGPAINSSVVKDKTAHRVMMRMAKPGVAKNGSTFLRQEAFPDEFEILKDYCKQDVLTERTIFKRIPRLPDDERKIWLMDMRMNMRGIGIDMCLVDKLSELTSLETSRLDKRINAASQGRVPKTSQVAKIKEFLQAGGVAVGSLSKNGIEEIIARTISGSVEREVLELRRDAAKVSTAKLKKMRGAVSDKKRAHGLTQYYGATRTGRWAGRLIQIQNLPRPFKGYDQPHAIDLIFDPATDRETIEIVYGSTMSLASATLRGCFIAASGKEFCITDFSQIEARVVAWLSDQEDALQVFRDGKDIYVHTAASIGSNDRQLGKVLVLACGFGMGAAKFMATAETYGVELSLPQAENLVQGWRAANNHIVATWYATSNAARNVIQNHVRDYWTPVGKLAFKMGKGKAAGALLMRLPNDRLLVYRDALIDYASNSHGEIFYSGVDQYTRQWSRQKTYGGKLIENAVQGIARDVMADAMLAMEARSFEIVGTIHDEIIVEADANRSMKVRDAMLEIMRITPTWATGLPVGAAGFVARRYRK